MTDLKTLKDFYNCDCGDENCPVIDRNELKAEAVKWVKDLDNLVYLGDAEYEHRITGKRFRLKTWIKHFFNLTEEDFEMSDQKNTPHTNRDELSKEEFERAVFEMQQALDQKITNLINRFDRLAKELGYKV